MDVAANKPQARAARLRPELHRHGRRTPPRRRCASQTGPPEPPRDPGEGHRGTGPTPGRESERRDVGDCYEFRRLGRPEGNRYDGVRRPRSVARSAAAGWGGKTPRTRAIMRAKSAAARRRAAILCPCPVGGSSDERSVSGRTSPKSTGSRKMGDVGEGWTSAGAAGYGARVTFRTAARPDSSRPASGAAVGRDHALPQGEQAWCRCSFAGD